MELHDHLYALGLQLGREVFDDPDAFRGALDDVVPEGEASTGDINLLVDAVRLGAYRSMVTMLDSGAEPLRAVEEAGARLARERGSSDIAGASWACAALGFALGRVGDADVRRYRTQSPPVTGGVPPQAATVLPTTPPPPPTQQPATPPTQQPAAAFAPPPPGSWPAPGAPSGPPGGPAPKKRTGLVVGAVVAAVLLIGGGTAAAVVLTGGDDESAGPGKDPTSSQSVSTAPTETDTPSPAVTDDVPTTVSDEAAQGYIDALGTFSPAFSEASDIMFAGADAHEFEKTLSGAAMMRDAIYDFDADVRELDLRAIQDSVDTLYTENAQMIRDLDRIQNTSVSRAAVRHVAELPIDSFIAAFTEVGEQIDAHRE